MITKIRIALKPYKLAIYIAIILTGLVLFIVALVLSTDSYTSSDISSNKDDAAQIPESSPKVDKPEYTLPEQNETQPTTTPTAKKTTYSGEIKFYATTTKVTFDYSPEWQLKESTTEIVLSKAGAEFYIGIAGEAGTCYYNGDKKFAYAHNSVYEPDSYVEISGKQVYRRQKTHESKLPSGLLSISTCRLTSDNGQTMFTNAFGESLLYVRYQVGPNYDEQLLREMDEITKTLSIE